MVKTEDLKKLDGIIKDHKTRKSGLVGILQDIQGQYNYLPKEALTYLAEKLNVPLSQTYSLATYYKAFSLKPQGEYLISLCMGTACHVRQAARILDEVQRKLNIKAGETSNDSKFTLETLNCLGCCAIGPVMMINGKYYGQMTVKKVDSILEKYKSKKE